MSLVHENFKVWYTYKGVLCQYLDGVNYNFDKHLSLGTSLERCHEKHPDSVVWYEVVNVHPYNAPNGKVYRNCRCLCDIKVIYAEKSQNAPVYGKVADKKNKPKISLLTVRKALIKKLTDGKYAVEKTEFVGTLTECNQFINYLKIAPQCYKDRAVKCHNMAELTMRTDIVINDDGSVTDGGKCICTKYTAEKNHKSDLNFRYKMHKGSAYLLY